MGLQVKPSVTSGSHQISWSMSTTAIAHPQTCSMPVTKSLQGDYIGDDIGEYYKDLGFRVGFRAYIALSTT